MLVRPSGLHYPRLFLLPSFHLTGQFRSLVSRPHMQAKGINLLLISRCVICRVYLWTRSFPSLPTTQCHESLRDLSMIVGQFYALFCVCMCVCVRRTRRFFSW
uniref:Uncharacterized protein n=1 Tax=Trypanosoma congolense (strain IL3000) TaxID=1068625 RepID=G0US43_TRYCI|nr:hypothetical protein, unlikely [Trypanosoma congolense IL3000]